MTIFSFPLFILSTRKFAVFSNNFLDSGECALFINRLRKWFILTIGTIKKIEFEFVGSFDPFVSMKKLQLQEEPSDNGIGGIGESDHCKPIFSCF